jgi:Spy/CpxP family protein refolding chaperone
MLWKLKPLFVLLSFALNGAVVATWVTQKYQSGPCPQAEQAGPCPLRQKIGASDEQWCRLEPRLTEFREACHCCCRDINRQRRELVELLAQPQADRAAIRAKQEEILKGQRQMEELVVDHLLADKEVLSPEQQRVLFDLLRTRCGCDMSDE